MTKVVPLSAVSVTSAHQIKLKSHQIRTISSYKLSAFYTLLLALLINHLIVIPAAALKHRTHDSAEELPDIEDGELDIDGFKIDEALMDVAEIELDSQEQSKIKAATKAPFEKSCPFSYFTCDSGECIAAKWRCDGHYDCDDFSDELNCTNAPNLSNHDPSSLVATKNLTIPSKIDIIGGINFKSSVEPLMIFSTGTSIRGYWMKSRVYFDIVSLIDPKATYSKQAPSISSALSVFFDIFSMDPHSSSVVDPRSEELQAKPRSTIVGIDMDPTNKEVYWAELGKDPSIYSAIIENEDFTDIKQRRNQHHPGYRMVVEFGLVAPEDIALDNVAKNAYITDAGLPAIVVCAISHSHCKIVNKANTLHKPRAIIADSTVGWLIYTDWGDHPGIYALSMDGEHQDTLIDTEIIWPNGLAADYEENVLYWADARLNKIERVDLATRKRFKIIKEVLTNPFSVAQFEDRIYWSDWAGNHIKTCNKTTGNNTKTLMSAQDIYGIHIYHPDMHKYEPANPCWSKHCSHLCLLSPRASTFNGRASDASVGAACACPATMDLSVGDRSTCYETKLSFVLVNEKNYIAQVFPEKIGLRVVEEIIYSTQHAIQDVASDWIHYKLFFFDASKRQIYSADLGGKVPKLQRLAPAGKSIRGLLYDSWSDNLFWLDPDVGSLSLYSVRGKFVKLLRENLNKPTSLALDSRNRLLYISMFGNKPKIIRLPLTGLAGEQAQRNTTITLVDTDIGLPIALHLDESGQRLYWADARRETIESIGLDIKSRSTGALSGTRQTHRRYLGTVLAFAVYDGSFMWTLQDDDYLYMARMDSRLGSKPKTFKLPQNPSFEHPETDHKRLISVQPAREAISSPCHRARCSHGCQLDAHLEALCFCPDGLRLEPANRSQCVEPPAEPTELRQSAPGGPMGESSRASGRIPVIGGAGNSVVPGQLRARPEPEAARQHFAERTSSALLNELRPPEDQPHPQQAQPDQAHLEAPKRAGQRADLGAAAGVPVAQPAPAGAGNRMVWLIVLLLLLSVTGLVTVASLLVLYRQGRLPRQVSQFTVSFMAPSSGGASAKDKAMLLLDTE